MTTLPIHSLGDASPPPVTAPGPLSATHLAQLDEANRRQKKLRRAFVVASVDAWLSAIFAGLTLLSGIFSIVGLVLGAALAGIAWNSFRGASSLRRLDITAPRRLALNQLALAGILIVYSIYSLLTARSGSGEFASAMSDPQLASMLGPIEHLVWLITVAVYGGLIAGTVVAQGLAALYYYRRGAQLKAYLAATPEWIQQIQKHTKRPRDLPQFDANFRPIRQTPRFFCNMRRTFIVGSDEEKRH